MKFARNYFTSSQMKSQLENGNWRWEDWTIKKWRVNTCRLLPLSTDHFLICVTFEMAFGSAIFKIGSESLILQPFFSRIPLTEDWRRVFVWYHLNWQKIRKTYLLNSSYITHKREFFLLFLLPYWVILRYTYPNSHTPWKRSLTHTMWTLMVEWTLVVHDTAFKF